MEFDSEPSRQASWGGCCKSEKPVEAGADLQENARMTGSLSLVTNHRGTPCTVIGVEPGLGDSW